MAEDEVSLGELSRRLSEVFVRFETLAGRLEAGQFVRTDLYVLYKENVNTQLKALQDRVASVESAKADKTLEQRVANLEDTNRWLMRLVIGFIILAVLGAVFAAAGGLQ